MGRLVRLDCRLYVVFGPVLSLLSTASHGALGQPPMGWEVGEEMGRPTRGAPWEAPVLIEQAPNGKGGQRTAPECPCLQGGPGRPAWTHPPGAGSPSTPRHTGHRAVRRSVTQRPEQWLELAILGSEPGLPS